MYVHRHLRTEQRDLSDSECGKWAHALKRACLLTTIRFKVQVMIINAYVRLLPYKSTVPVAIFCPVSYCLTKFTKVADTLTESDLMFIDYIATRHVLFLSVF